jgi:hypothetical protein
MPVEASDIVQGAMNTGGFPYTGCEEEGLGSDDDVRKRWNGQDKRSFPTKSTLRTERSRGSRGNQDQHLNPACKNARINRACFPQMPQAFSGKRENKPLLPFTFLMRIGIRLCQTEDVHVVCEQVLRFAGALHSVLD